MIQFFSPKFGGSSIVPYNLSKTLEKKGHQVTIVTSDYKVSQEWIDSSPNIDVFPFKTRLNFKELLITPGMRKFAKEGLKDFDVIHMHNYRTFQNIVVHHYAKKYGIPYILQAHGSLPRSMAKQRLKWIYDAFFGNRLLKDASKLIALNQMEAEQYMDMGVPDEKIAIIPNGIDFSEYADLPSKGEFKKKFNITEDKKIILYVGRIHKMKGIDFLLKAFAYLINKMNLKDVLLVVVGADDGYLHEVKSLSASLGVSNSVLFTGLISNKDKISAYVDSSICCYLNPNEPFGLVPLEATSCRTPVIVCTKTYMSQVLNQGKFGSSIKYGDINELAGIMEKILDNEKLLREIGEKGRKFVFENFTIENVVDRFEVLYKEIAYERA